MGLTNTSTLDYRCVESGPVSLQPTTFGDPNAAENHVALPLRSKILISGTLMIICIYGIQ